MEVKHEGNLLQLSLSKRRVERFLCWLSRPRGSVGMVASYNPLTDCWGRVRIPPGPRVRLKTDQRPGSMPYGARIKELDAGWPESEEEQVGNVKLEEEVTRRSKD